MTGKIRKTWMITGCSSGIGKGIAKAVLDNGDNAVITARDTDKLTDMVREYPERALAVSLEVTDMDSIHNAVKAAKERFGTIDVLVNNAGRGYSGAVEEADEKAVEQLFATNFFGPVALMKAVLPGMRERKEGAIINISSLGVLTCSAGAGYYSASKAALEKISTALRKEVEEIGIKVMVVEPGPFRTNFRVAHVKGDNKCIPDYRAVAEARAKLSDNPFDQKGDPKKAGKIIVQMIEREDYPRMLLLGGGSTNTGVEILKEEIKEIARWKEISDSADFEK